MMKANGIRESWDLSSLRWFIWALLLTLAMSTLARETAIGESTAAEKPAVDKPAVESPAANSPVGRWKTIDEKSGKAKSIVRIWEENGKLRGKVETLFREPGQEQDPVCKVCPEGTRGEKIRGMTILWDLAPAGEWWEGGRILDPANGKVYKCRMLPMESGKKLQVRGFIGISMLGRSQVWVREP
jgi:uncharacterized protein (DUF2147 family)